MPKRVRINHKIHINGFFLSNVLSRCHGIFKANFVLFLWLLFQLRCVAHIGTFYHIVHIMLI